MVDPTILKEYGSDHEAIKAVFTCEQPDAPLYGFRKQFEKRINARLINGWTFALQNSHLYAASDLAWDAAPITRDNIPLLLYAQKKINISRCAEELETLGCASHFVRKDTDGVVKEIDLPKLFETPVNLLRSYITRRVAPQATKYTDLYPFMKFEPRATDPVGKLRGDATSQRVEDMADAYGYRHHQTQIIRDMLLYGHDVVFPSCAWDREVQWVNVPTGVGDAMKLEAKVVREGVDFFSPHPSRVFWDMMYPLSTINTNTGAEYVGYWDLRKYSDILSNPAYFNRDKIRQSTNGRDFYQQYRLYFDSQFNAQRIRFTTLSDLKSRDPVAGNDPKVIAPFYQGCDADEALFFTEYYERCIPAENGLGRYPHPVWIRLIVASDDTVIFGEFLPTSTPAIYFGYNENDARTLNCSMAHEIMPFQDQVTNLLGQLLLSAKGNALKIVLMNQDVIDDNVREGVKKTMQGDKYYVDPLVIEYSGNKALATGQNPADAVKIVERSASDDITTYFKAITSLLSIIERMLVLSPQELGQPAQRIITATEMNEIATSTSTVYSFISDSIDEGRAAWKKFIYESLVTKSTETVRVPVIDRYTDDVIAAAGFSQAPVIGDPKQAQQFITGSKEKLIHDYTFTNRDGADRASSAQTAQTLTQLLAQVVSQPMIMQAIGKEKLFEMVNEIFRQSGTGFDLKLTMKPGDSDQFGPSQEQQIGQALQQLSQQIQSQGKQIQQTANDTQVQGQQLQSVLAALLPKGPAQPGPNAPTMPGQVQPGVFGPGGPPPSGPQMPMAPPPAMPPAALNRRH